MASLMKIFPTLCLAFLVTLSVRAAPRMGELMKHKGESGLSFRQVSDLAASLSDEKLVELAKEIGTGRTHGMRGWVRAALYAEWGKRDFAGAMKQLSGSAHLDSGHQQALYAVFRGSRPAEPAKALFHLQRMFQNHGSATGAVTRGWAKRALQDVFADLAAQQPQRAWELLTSEHETGKERMALEFLSKKFSRGPRQSIDSEWIALAGFFRGLRDRKTVEEYAERFRQAWNTPEVVAALKKFYKQFESLTGSMSWTPPPPHEGVARAVALSLARFDLGAAVGWIVKSGPGTDREKRGRASSVYTDWAWANPKAALAVLQKGEHINWHQQIAVALMRGDARLAPDVAKMKYSWFAGAMSRSFPAAATMMSYDLYPVPEKNPTLPSHQVRYEAFREAMKVGGLSGKTMESTKRSLDGSFRYTVPAAQKAYDLAQGN